MNATATVTPSKNALELRNLSCHLVLGNVEADVAQPLK